MKRTLLCFRLLAVVGILTVGTLSAQHKLLGRKQCKTLTRLSRHYLSEFTLLRCKLERRDN